jgi:tRNA (guanine26-N2/guanine27-N2)-dimethyltransferase
MYVEGKAKISESGKAFLNQKAKVSRDISVAYVAAAARRERSVLDATAASGIRGIRYCLEADAGSLTALEINKGAYSVLRQNLRRNGISARALNTSIQQFANASGERFGFIDLDPFGGIGPYVFDLMKVSEDRTELMATATDTAVLCGANRRACIRLYDSKPIHNELCHEAGLRIMLGYIARTAAEFNFGIVPTLSFSYMHYMRAFVRLEHGAEKAMNSVSESGYLHYCDSCGYRIIEKAMVSRGAECLSCRKQMAGYGRMWLGPLKQEAIVERVYGFIKDDKRMGEAERLVGQIKNESDEPFYYHMPTITKRLKMGAVSPGLILKGLSNAGFSASYTHMSGSSIKTDADIRDIMKLVKEAGRA